MKALLLHLLRRQRALLLVICGFLLVLEAIFVHVLQSIQAVGGLDKLSGALGGFLQNLLRNQLGEVSARYSLGVFFRDPALLVPTLAVLMLAASQVRADRESGLADVYLARPLSRARYLATHALVTLFAGTAVALSVLAGLGLGLATARLQDPLPFVVYAQVAAAFLALMVFFGALTLWLSTGEARRGLVAARVTGVAVVGFLFEMFGPHWQPMATWRVLSPFFYFHPLGILDAHTGRVAAPALDPEGFLFTGEPLFPQPGALVNAAVLLGFAALFVALAFRRFARRDL